MGKPTSAKPQARSAKDTEMIWRQNEVAKFHLEGKTQKQIAEMLGISQPTVARAIKAVRAGWAKEYADTYDSLVGRELAILDRETRILEGLRDSYLAKQTEDGQYSGATMEGLLSITDRLHRVGEQRRRVLGVGGVNKVAFTDASGKDNVFSQDWRETLKARLLEEEKNKLPTDESGEDA